MTSTGWTPPTASSPAKAARPATLRSWPVEWASRPSPESPTSRSTPNAGSPTPAPPSSPRVTRSPSTAPPARSYLRALPLIEPEETAELHDLLTWADEIRTLGVRANADTPEDAAKARAYGAEGIGLARTEHMFMGDRLAIVQTIILADDDAESREALTELKALQTATSSASSRPWMGLPVVVRLLDPPLHEFLPSLLDLEHQMVDRVRARRLGGRPRAGPPPRWRGGKRTTRCSDSAGFVSA